MWRSVKEQQGSGPDKGKSPVEWGEISSIHPSSRPSIRPSIRPSVYHLSGWPSAPEGQLQGSKGLLEGSEGWQEWSKG